MVGRLGSGPGPALSITTGTYSTGVKYLHSAERNGRPGLAVFLSGCCCKLLICHLPASSHHHLNEAGSHPSSLSLSSTHHAPPTSPTPSSEDREGLRGEEGTLSRLFTNCPAHNSQFAFFAAAAFLTACLLHLGAFLCFLLSCSWSSHLLVRPDPQAN